MMGHIFCLSYDNNRETQYFVNQSYIIKNYLFIKFVYWILLKNIYLSKNIGYHILYMY